MDHAVGSDQSEKIVVIGFGWVGQANALALAKMGFRVFYYDIVTPAYHYADEYKDLYEKIPGLKNVLEMDDENTWYLICVGDRTRTDGTQDISLIEKVLLSLAGASGKIVIRSTVLPQNLGGLKFDFYLPEFLHEKKAVEECLDPFYFVVGRSAGSVKQEPKFFAEWEKRSYKIFRGTPEQASYIKYLSNIWNALRIAFINEFGTAIAEPSDKQKIKEIEKVVDFVLERGNYLRYGRSYGGHCLPKDTYAFATAFNTPLVRGVHESNLLHKKKEALYSDLPEWFSFWDYAHKKTIGTFLRQNIERFNSLPYVKRLRQWLKPIVMRAYDAIVPGRTLEDTVREWNKRGIQNARFYMQTKTKSGMRVDEFEVRETGSDDYRKYVARDDITRETLGDTRERTALEIGCGIGRMTEFFSPDFRQVYGIDISDVMIENAKKRLSHLHNVTLAANDGQSIPFGDEQFDFIFSYLVLQHIQTTESIQTYLQHMYRTLKPGGLAKIQLRTGPGIRKWRWSYGVALPPHQARELAEQSGFTVLTHEVEQIKNLWLWLKK